MLPLSSVVFLHLESITSSLFEITNSVLLWQDPQCPTTTSLHQPESAWTTLAFPWASSPWLRPCMMSPILPSHVGSNSWYIPNPHLLFTWHHMLSAMGTLTSGLPLHLIVSAPLLFPAAELPASHAFLSSTILFLYCCTHPPSVTPSLKYMHVVMISEKLFRFICTTI